MVRWVLAFCSVVLFLVVGFLVFGGQESENGSSVGEGVGTSSKGAKSGYVLSMSCNGTLKSSWEVDLLLGYNPMGFFPAVANGGANLPRPEYSNTWSFSVPSSLENDVVAKLDRAMVTGGRVVIYYEKKRIKGALVDTDYLVTKVIVCKPSDEDPVLEGEIATL